MEASLDYLAPFFPYFINDKYDKSETLLSKLATYDKYNLDSLSAGSLPLGGVDDEMGSKMKAYFLSRKGIVYMGRAILTVLNFIYLQFKYNTTSLRRALFVHLLSCVRCSKALGP